MGRMVEKMSVISFTAHKRSRSSQKTNQAETVVHLPVAPKIVARTRFSPPPPARNLSVTVPEAMEDLNQAIKDNGEVFGLFGAIEIGFTNGPFLLHRPYHMECEVVCVGQSPQTEYVWYETKAWNPKQQLVATMLMQSRAMKASSPAYQT